MMYRIIYKDNLTNINAKVNNKNELEVTAPTGLDVNLIDQFILNHFDKFYIFIKNRQDKSMYDLNNNFIYIKAKKYEIINNIIPNKNQKYEIINNRIHLFLKNEENKEKMIEKILFDIGKDYIIDLAKKISKKNKFQVNEFDVKSYKNKWGQCEPGKKKITLAIQLIMFNDEIIEYVIIHELCHLVYPDHSSSFWKLVEQYYPKYKWAREKLKFQV